MLDSTGKHESTYMQRGIFQTTAVQGQQTVLLSAGDSNVESLRGVTAAVELYDSCGVTHERTRSCRQLYLPWSWQHRPTQPCAPPVTLPVAYCSILQ